jgi:hypothetical protein
MIFKYSSYGTSSEDKKLFLGINSEAKRSKIELFWGGFGIILSPKP